MEDQIWSARDRTVIATTKQYLEESESFKKVEVEELESLLGPDDSDVDFRRILEEATDENGCAIFEPSEFLVVRSTRWDKHQKKAEGTVAAKTRLLHRVEDSGKRARKNSGLHGARRKEMSRV